MRNDITNNCPNNETPWDCIIAYKVNIRIQFLYEAPLTIMTLLFMRNWASIVCFLFVHNYS